MTQKYGGGGGQNSQFLLDPAPRMRATLESMEAEKGALVQFGVCVASRVDANEALARLPSGTYTTSVTCEMVVVMISFVPDSRRYFLMKAENKCQVMLFRGTSSPLLQHHYVVPLLPVTP